MYPSLAFCTVISPWRSPILIFHNLTRFASPRPHLQVHKILSLLRTRVTSTFNFQHNCGECRAHTKRNINTCCSSKPFFIFLFFSLCRLYVFGDTHFKHAQNFVENISILGTTQRICMNGYFAPSPINNNTNSFEYNTWTFAACKHSVCASVLIKLLSIWRIVYLLSKTIVVINTIAARLQVRNLFMNWLDVLVAHATHDIGNVDIRCKVRSEIH